MENPELLPKDGAGSEWLKEMRSSMMRLHADIFKASDSIKQSRADEANRRNHSELDGRAGQIKVGGYVRTIRDSMENAKYIRKHGHGAPWKHKYLVKEVRPQCKCNTKWCTCKHVVMGQGIEMHWIWIRAWKWVSGGKEKTLSDLRMLRFVYESRKNRLSYCGPWERSLHRDTPPVGMRRWTVVPLGGVAPRMKVTQGRVIRQPHSTSFKGVKARPSSNSLRTPSSLKDKVDCHL